MLIYQRVHYISKPSKTQRQNEKLTCVKRTRMWHHCTPLRFQAHSACFFWYIHPTIPECSVVLERGQSWRILSRCVQVGLGEVNMFFFELNEGELCKNTLSIMDGFPLNVHSAQLNETLESEELQCRQFSDM